MDVGDGDLEGFKKAAEEFLAYGKLATHDLVSAREARVAALPAEQQRMAMALVISHVSRLRACIHHNAEICAMIAANLDHLLNGTSAGGSLDPDSIASWDQVRMIMGQLCREWSSDGLQERIQSFDPVIDALLSEFPDSNGRKVLVPGCGLGRLPFELAKRGFHADGNEFSTTMLLAQHFVLNSSTKSNEMTLYPYVHATSHYRTTVDQIRDVKIPDEWPAGVDLPGEMSMLCGQFNSSFNDSKNDEYDAVATVFFLDTASNIFETVELISRLVRPGGIWINFGPLHWHYEKVSGSELGGLELTLDNLIQLIELNGWSFEQHKSRVPATYCATNPHRMSPYVYDCEFWIARRTLRRRTSTLS